MKFIDTHQHLIFRKQFGYTWTHDIPALASEYIEFMNLGVKLSGISAYCQEGTATDETLRPWVAHILDSFGPACMVWGSDWPVVNRETGLAPWCDITRSLLGDLSDNEQAQIANRNAGSIYGVYASEPSTRLFRAARSLSRSALSWMKPAASFWSYAPASSSKVTWASE